MLFLTDGDPTAYNLDQDSESGGVDTSGVSAESVARAVEEADQVKSQGSQIIAIGVGSALTSADSVDRLQKVSGPDVYDGTGTLDVATLDDYNNGLLCAESRDANDDGSTETGPASPSKGGNSGSTPTTTTTTTSPSSDDADDHPGKGRAVGKKDNPGQGKKP